MCRSVSCFYLTGVVLMLASWELALGGDSDKPKDGGEKSAPTKVATFGEGFRPCSASVFERSALDNASILHRYANAPENVTNEVLQEHLVEVERQLANLKKEYAKLGEELRKQKNLQAQIQSVEQHSAKAKQQCDMLEQAVQSGKTDRDKTREYCDVMCKELKASLEQHYKLMRGMGIKRPWYPHGLDPNGPSYDPEQM